MRIDLSIISKKLNNKFSNFTDTLFRGHMRKVVVNVVVVNFPNSKVGDTLASFSYRII